MSVSYVDRQTLAVLAPTVRAALGISREDYGRLLAAFSLAYLGSAVVGLAWVPAWMAMTSRADVKTALALAEVVPSGPPAPRLTLLRAPQVLRALVIVLATAPSIMFALNWTAQYLADVYA